MRKWLAGLLRCRTHNYVLTGKRTTDYGYMKENRWYYECDTCGDETYTVTTIEKKLGGNPECQ